jgi:hypothetical protein
MMEKLFLHLRFGMVFSGVLEGKSLWRIRACLSVGFVLLSVEDREIESGELCWEEVLTV